MSINHLNLSDKITDMLNYDSWTVKDLAQADVNTLIKYNGIGAKRAKNIIDKAQQLINENV